MALQRTRELRRSNAPRGVPRGTERVWRRRWSRWAGCGALGLLLAVAACGDRELTRIRMQQAEGNMAPTIEPLRRLLAERPLDAELHFRYGAALSHTGQSSLAVWSLREAMDDPEWFVPASLEYARSAIATRDYRAAIEAMSAVLEEEPEHLDALRLRGQARLEDKADAEGGLEDFSRALELDPDDLATRLSQLRARLAVGQVDEARSSFEELTALAVGEGLLEDEVAAICTAAATFEKEGGALGRARELFDHCLEAHPRSAQVLGHAVEFFDAAGMVERGSELLRDYLERVPGDTRHRGLLARRLRGLGDADAAEALLLEASRAPQPHVRQHAWSALTDHYIAQGDFTAAVEAFESGMEGEGELSARRRLAYADLLVGAGQHARALEEAAELEDATLRDLVRARVQWSDGQACEALATFEGAFPFWPNNAVARYYAARSAEQCGDFDRAAEHYRQSLRSGSQSSDAGLRLARLMSAEGRPEDALFGLQQHLATHPRNAETVLRKARAALQLREGRTLQALLGSLPPSRLRARVLAMLAQHAAIERGAEAAIEGLRSDPGLDLRSARDAPALEVLVALLVDEGRSREAHQALDAALARQPQAPDLEFVRATLLRREAASAAAQKAAYERVVSLDPDHARGLLELGRLLAAEGEVERAVALLDRAYAADPTQSTPAREAALLLAAQGDGAEAQRRLADLLRELPADGAAALELARLRLARDATDARTQVLARQALRFGAGEAARALMRAPEAPAVAVSP